MLGSGHDAADAALRAGRRKGVEKRLTVGRRIPGQSKVALENGLQIGRTGQTGLPDQSMGREDGQAAVLGTGQIRQDVMKGPVLVRAGLCRPLAAVLQRGFIAVMAVGDNQRFVRELRRNIRNDRRVPDGPQPMRDPRVVRDLHRCRLGERLSEGVFERPARTGVETENRTQMRPAGAQQGEAIFFGRLKGALVRANDPGLEIFDPQRGKDTGPLPGLAVLECVFLGVAVEAGLRVRLHDSPGQPILKSPGRRRIGVVRLVEVEMGGVIRTLEMEERLLFRTDYVVWRGDDFFQVADNRRIIA